MLKKAFLVSLVVSVVVSALLGIAALLIGQFGELQVKVLLTTVTISAFSICALCCAAFFETRRGVALPLTGILLGAVGGVLVVSGIWSEPGNETYWKTAGSFSVVAVAIAHMCLLSLARLREGHAWALWAAYVTIGVLAGLIVYAIWGEPDEETFFRWMGVDAILATALSILIPVLHRLGSVAAEALPDEGRACRVVCPSCGVEETHFLGRIQCNRCGCVFVVRVLRDGTP
jgi:hypothetical protein